MTMGTEGAVTFELPDGVAWLGLNRPHKRNAIGEALLAALEAAARRPQDEARALVIKCVCQVSKYLVAQPIHPPDAAMHKRRFPAETGVSNGYDSSRK